MEVSFSKEIEALRLGAGDTFHGEGILAITKGLLQSGVAYVGGYQGAPVSHLLDVMVQAKPYMDELGVHVEACSNEASAAAMLGASIHYPLRGAVTWKSIVGTNVAADALSNLSSPGVNGGVLIVVGEDYGEGASVIQERTHAYALKSSMCLLDPRPDLGVMVRMVEHGFRLSEASNMPCMMELRIRTCHVRGSFECKDNLAPADLDARADGRAGRLRLHAARASAGDLPPREAQGRGAHSGRAPLHRRARAQRTDSGHAHADLGIVVQGGLYNALIRSLQQLGLADAFGATDIPLAGAQRHLPAGAGRGGGFLRRQARRAGGRGRPARVHRAGDRHAAAPARHPDAAARQGLAAGRRRIRRRGAGRRPGELRRSATCRGHAQDSAQALARGQPRPPRRGGDAAGRRRCPRGRRSFCIGCPERPVFAALKLAQQDSGPVHIAADIGCHAFGTFEPFSMGHSILGYGMSLASRAGVSPMMQRRALSIMGDGGFWHNGLLTGVQSALFNGDDAVLLIFKNGYTSATGTQDIISTPDEDVKEHAVGQAAEPGRQATRPSRRR